MAGKKPACGNSSKTDSPSLTQPCVYVAVNFLCQVILKINIQRLLCTVIKFQEVLYSGQDFYVNFDRG